MTRTQRRDLILVDIALPGIDGYDVCRRLRARAGTATTSIVALSANAMQADIDKGKQAGFDAYLTKPVGISIPLAQVDRLHGLPNYDEDGKLGQRSAARCDTVESANRS